MIYGIFLGLSLIGCGVLSLWFSLKTTLIISTLTIALVAICWALKASGLGKKIVQYLQARKAAGATTAATATATKTPRTTNATLKTVFWTLAIVVAGTNLIYGLFREIGERPVKSERAHRNMAAPAVYTPPPAAKEETLWEEVSQGATRMTPNPYYEVPIMKIIQPGTYKVIVMNENYEAHFNTGTLNYRTEGIISRNVRGLPYPNKGLGEILVNKTSTGKELNLSSGDTLYMATNLPGDLDYRQPSAFDAGAIVLRVFKKAS